MTTELSERIEPKPPIRIDVVQKQFKNGMKLPQLARLYEVDEETLKPIVAEIVPKKRKESKGQLSVDFFSKEDLIELLERNPHATAFKQNAGIDSDKQMNELLERHGLQHMVKTRAQVIAERNAEVVELLENGLSHKQIEQRLSVNSSFILRALSATGRDDLRRRTKAEQTPEQLQALADKIRELVETKTSKEITAELGINTTLLHKLRKEHGIKVPKKPPRKHRWNGSKPKDGPKAHQKKRETPANRQYDYEQVAKQIAAMFEEGMKVADIIKELNLSNVTYYKIKKEYGKGWAVTDGRKKSKPIKKPCAPPLITPEEPKEETTMPEVTTASLESAVTAFKEEEKPDLIGMLHDKMEHIARAERIEKRVLNRDKGVWAEYLTARSEEIANVTHDTDLVTENGKLIERTTLTYTLERELGR